MRVSVIGGGTATADQRATARAVGKAIARRGHELVCGGLGGVMEAACAGAREAGGRTIGIVPGTERSAANDHVETIIATGMGHGRNALVVLNGDGAVAVDGGPGTLSEIGLAAAMDRPVAGLGTHDVPYVEQVADPEVAVEYVERRA